MTDLEGAVEKYRELASSLVSVQHHAPEVELRLYRELADEAGPAIIDLLDALASITRERDAIREGLKPFAARIVDIGIDEDDGDRFSNALTPYSQSVSVKVGDIRRAAALVNGEGGE